ncbi:MAG: STAS domain-containing protein [Eubacteriales bacterium]|jgi:anti-sigma B factor antagonist|nr:STAS domain-containing protein [Eubacteriales bacterium]MDD3571526.1 STAS domain-containing protein [Eubacteriales bacterium]MDD4134455.1 STAS domain-containing protein [Eubacteriales bacterium]NLO13610.1 STAS domain-containing protein [Clostridiales bacterium]
MTIEETREGGRLRLKITGRLDSMTSRELEATLRSGVEGITQLEFEMRETEYVSSAGLRVILAAQKVMNRQGSLTILNPNRAVTEVFEITGFSEILTILEDTP